MSEIQIGNEQPHFLDEIGIRSSQEKGLDMLLQVTQSPVKRTNLYCFCYIKKSFGNSLQQLLVFQSCICIDSMAIIEIQ